MLLTLSSSVLPAPQASVASHKAESVDFNIAPGTEGWVDSWLGSKRKKEEKGERKTVRAVCARWF